MKLHKKLRDNRGLSLVELIVAVAISAIAIGAIWQFILVSTRSYESSKAEAELQQEVQQTMNQMQNLLIDTNKAVAYFYKEADASYTQLNSDYDTPKDATKRLEVYNDDTIAHLTWDKDEKQLVYEEVLKDDASDDSKWESAVLAEGVESLAIDLSQVEKKQVLKVKMSFERNDKTYTATRNIALRNAIVNTGNVDDIYEEAPETIKPMIVINGVEDDILYPRGTHTFTATVSNADNNDLLWTVQGAKSEDTSMNISSGELVIGATETAETLTIIATLESNRTVNGIYQLHVGDPKAPTVKIYDERIITDEKADPKVWGGDISAKVQAELGTDKLVISALCGEEYKIPICAEVKPAEYSHKWTFIPTKEGEQVDASIEVKRDSSGALQEYLIVGTNQIDDFWLRCDVVSNEASNGYDLCYVNVIAPEPEIWVKYGTGDNDIAQNEDITLFGGTKIEIGAVWGGVIAEAEGQFGYNKTLLDQHDIIWTITTYHADGTEPTVGDPVQQDATKKIGTTLSSYNADKLVIEAKSAKYTGVTFKPITITVDEPVLTMKAYEIDYIEVEDSKTETIKTEAIKTEFQTATTDTIHTADLYQEVQFEADYKGGSTDNLRWKISFDGGKSDIKLEHSGEVAKWNTVKTEFGDSKERMFGKTVTVTVYDKDAPNSVKASVTFQVKDAKKCDLTIDSEDANVKTYDYLQPNKAFDYLYEGEQSGKKYIANYAFLVDIDYEYDFEIADMYVIKSDNSIPTDVNAAYIMGTKEDLEKKNILFKPPVLETTEKEKTAKNIKSIVYDIDDKYTGEHICFIRLNMELSNFNARITKKAWLGETTYAYVAYVTNQNDDSIIKKFVNYYGWDIMSVEHDSTLDYASLSPVPYKCEYEYFNGLFGWGSGWYITIYDNSNTQVYQYRYN